MVIIILDRYEGDTAVLEIDGENKDVPKNLLQNGIDEGSVLIYNNGKYILDKDETEKRRKEIIDLQNALFE